MGTRTVVAALALAAVLVSLTCEAAVNSKYVYCHRIRDGRMHVLLDYDWCTSSDPAIDDKRATRDLQDSMEKACERRVASARRSCDRRTVYWTVMAWLLSRAPYVAPVAFVLAFRQWIVAALYAAVVYLVRHPVPVPAALAAAAAPAPAVNAPGVGAGAVDAQVTGKCRAVTRRGARCKRNATNIHPTYERFVCGIHKDMDDLTFAPGE
jgi:hypothetical protein